MTYEHKSAVYALNSYVWKLLEANLEWNKENYGGRTPVIPTSQQPELLATGRPFVVYGSAVHPASHLYSFKTEAVSYNVYGTSITEVNKIVSLLAETFERQDIAASDVNEWMNTEAAGRSIDRGISFASIRTSMAERAEPADEEGGNYSALILLEVKYTVNNDTLTTSGFTYTP